MSTVTSIDARQITDKWRTEGDKLAHGDYAMPVVFHGKDNQHSTKPVT